MTHKSSLITFHDMGQNIKLLVANIHAINFVTAKVFKEEIERIETQISNFKGPVIVAGDFNTWSEKKIKILEEFAKRLSLVEVIFQDDKHIKKVFNKRLDYIFYKGLHVEVSKAIKNTKLSDHNPLIVKFNINFIHQ